MLRITWKALLFTDSALANWTLAFPLVPKHSSTLCHLCSSQFLLPELLSMRTVVWSSPVLDALHLNVTLVTVLQDSLIKKKNAVMDLLQNHHSIPMKLGC